MAESRDRLSRPVDIAALYASRRLGILGVYQDQPDLHRELASPIRRPTATSPVGHEGGGFGTPRANVGRGRNMFPTPATGRENRPVGSLRRGAANRRGRASSNYLPSWYPRAPLRDVTAIAQAYQRRRESLGGNRAQEIETPNTVSDSAEFSPVVAHLEHNQMMKTPKPSTSMKRCPPSVGKVSTILRAITSKPTENDAEFLTPQKKLLNSIDTVGKAVMQELRKLERTPSARRAERAKKVKTLMSLR